MTDFIVSSTEVSQEGKLDIWECIWAISKVMSQSMQVYNDDMMMGNATTN